MIYIIFVCYFSIKINEVNEVPLHYSNENILKFFLKYFH